MINSKKFKLIKGFSITSFLIFFLIIFFIMENNYKIDKLHYIAPKFDEFNIIEEKMENNRISYKYSNEKSNKIFLGIIVNFYDNKIISNKEFSILTNTSPLKKYDPYTHRQVLHDFSDFHEGSSDEDILTCSTKLSGLYGTERSCDKLYYNARYGNIIYKFYYYSQSEENSISNIEFYNQYLKFFRDNFEEQLREF